MAVDSAGSYARKPPGWARHIEIENATHIDVHAAESLTTVQLAGSVAPVLQSTCVWAPGLSSDVAGLIRTVDVSESGLPFGLGAGAFGAPPEQAVKQLGEYVLIEGSSWWTPAAERTSSRVEGPKTPLLTPFLFLWDHMMSATGELRSRSAVPLVHWYEYLLRRLVELGICSTGAIAVEVIADMPARLIVSKHLSRPPLRENQPPDQRLITDGTHLDAYFLRNGVAYAHGDDTWCTAMMVGIALDPASAAATWGHEFVQRGFYLTPGVATTSPVIHHTHALVTAQLPAAQAPGEGQTGTAERLSRVNAEFAAGSRAVQAIHIESDTLLFHADVRVGVVGAIEMD